MSILQHARRRKRTLRPRRSTFRKESITCADTSVSYSTKLTSRSCSSTLSSTWRRSTHLWRSGLVRLSVESKQGIFVLTIAPLAVFRTFSKELKEGGLDVLAPVSRLAPADGMATTDEVMDVVTRRRGQVRSRPQPLPCEPHLTTSTRSFQILSASTILKSDFFSNLQKQSLPECVILYRRSASLRFELTSFDRPPCTQASRRRCQLPKSRGCGCLRPGSSIVEDRLRNWNAIH